MEIWIAVAGFATAFLGFASRLNLRLTAEERRRLRIERDLELLAVLPKGPEAKRLKSAVMRAAGEMLDERERDKTNERLTTLILVSSGSFVVMFVAFEGLSGGGNFQVLVTEVISLMLAVATIGAFAVQVLAVVMLAVVQLRRRRDRKMAESEQAAERVEDVVTE